MIRRLAVLVAAGVLAGCSILPSSEPQAVYALPPADTSLATQSAQHAVSLKVLTPGADRLTYSRRILVQPQHGEISAYKDVQWSDTPPAMVRDYVVDVLRHQAGVAEVSSDSSHVAADLELGTDLTTFRVIYEDDQPVVDIRMDAVLIDSASRRVVSGRRLQVKQAVDGKEVPEVVDAFGVAMAQTTEKLVPWVMDTLKTYDVDPD